MVWGDVALDVAMVPPIPAVAPVPGVKPARPYSTVYVPTQLAHDHVIWPEFWPVIVTGDDMAGVSGNAGMAFIATDEEAGEMQPFASVTVTVYVLFAGKSIEPVAPPPEAVPDGVPLAVHNPEGMPLNCTVP